MYANGRGRFVQPDPTGLKSSALKEPLSLNLYAYVKSDPVNLTDPTGLDLITWTGASYQWLCNLGLRFFCDTYGQPGTRRNPETKQELIALGLYTPREQPQQRKYRISWEYTEFIIASPRFGCVQSGIFTIEKDGQRLTSSLRGRESRNILLLTPTDVAPFVPLSDTNGVEMTDRFGLFVDFQGFNFDETQWRALRDALQGRTLTVLTVIANTIFDFFEGARHIGTTSVTTIAKLKFNPDGVDCNVNVLPKRGSEFF
jgi:hypothetical protein